MTNGESISLNEIDTVVNTVKRKARNTVRKVLDETKKLKREVGKYPPALKRFLSQNGDKLITDLKVVRSPVQSFVKSLMGLVSLGTYDRAVKDADYDAMMHLALFVNNSMTLDKQEVVKMSSKNPVYKNSEVMDVGLGGKSVSVSEFVENCRKYMGDVKFSNYNAKTNNCQDFVLGCLEGNGLMTNELKLFVKQDADAVFKGMPWYSERFALVLTDLGAVADKMVEGGSIAKKESFRDFYAQKTKGKKFASIHAVREHMKLIAKEWKEIKTNKQDTK